MAVAAPRPSPRVTARAAAAQPLTAPRPRPRDHAQVRARRSPLLTRWILWIAVVAALLAGIVGLNVALLQLRMEGGRLQSEIVRIRAENDSMQAELSTASAGGRVETIARGRLGLVEATETSYLKVEPKER